MWLPSDGFVCYHSTGQASCVADTECGLVAPAAGGALDPLWQEMVLLLIVNQTCSVLLSRVNLPLVQSSTRSFPTAEWHMCKVTAHLPCLLLGSRLVLSTHKPSSFLGRKRNNSTETDVSTCQSKIFPRSFRITKTGGVF